MKPGVGSIEEWKRHELRSQSNKRHISNYGLQTKKYRNVNISQTIGSRGGSIGMVAGDTFSTAPGTIIVGPDFHRGRPPVGRFQLPKLSVQENMRLQKMEK